MTQEEIKINEDSLFEPEGELVVDVWENEKEIVVEAPIAGVDKDQIEIIVEDNILRVKGARGTTRIEEGRNYLLKECYWGSFSKEIALPEKIKKSGVKASVEDSVLTIRLPKKAPTKTKKVEIK